MKITKGRLKQLIKEELEAFQVKEEYTPVPQDMLSSPGAAISHMDSQLVAMDDGLGELMRYIDGLDDRFARLKVLLQRMVEKFKKDASPTVDAGFRDDPSLAEKLTKTDKKRKKELEKELDAIQHK